MNNLSRRVLVLLLTCLIPLVLISACAKSPAKTPVIEITATEAKPAAKIAFSSGPNGNFDIFVMNEDGSGKIQITDDPGNDVNPIWSNDGKKIAFISDRGGTQQLYVMEADGGNQVRLSSGSGIEYAPDWSPDSQKVAFTSFLDGNSDIYVVNADGTNLIRLTSDNRSDVGSNWSPDGQKIIYSSEVDGNYEIIMMNADGSDPLNLTNNPARDTCPVWSADGKKISFNSDRDGTDGIYLMNPDGSEQFLLTPGEGYMSCSDWSQDGKKITFSMQANGRSDIYVIDIEENSVSSISDGLTFDYDPNWSPGVTSRIVARAATPTVELALIPTATVLAAVPAAPVGEHRDIKIAYVITAEAQTLYSDLIKSFQTGIDQDLAERNISVTWATIPENDESLRSLQSNPKAYDIVMLSLGQPPADISSILRGWMQNGGIVWAFDNGSFSTWRNKDLLGGLLPGADVTWEPPEQVQAMVQGLAVLPYDESSPLAMGVAGDMDVTGGVTISQDANTKIIYANLTTFDRALDANVTPLLKAQKVGEAVIGGQTPQPGEWVVVGMAKDIEKGQVVVLPFLALDLASVQQFQANLIEWGLDQVGK